MGLLTRIRANTELWVKTLNDKPYALDFRFYAIHLEAGWFPGNLFTLLHLIFFDHIGNGNWVIFGLIIGKAAFSVLWESDR